MTPTQFLLAALASPGVIWAAKRIIAVVLKRFAKSVPEVDYLREQLRLRDEKCEKCRRAQQQRENKIHDLQSQIRSWEQLDDAFHGGSTLREDEPTQPGGISRKRKVTLR